ncbi:MAG: helix-turn-helix domain-containing protein [Bacteroidota bacterium]
MISEKTYRPNSPLNQYVDFVWVGQASSLDITSSHHAATFTELIFNYGDIFQINGQNTENFNCQFVHHIISGLKTVPFQTTVSGTYNSLGLILKPFCFGILKDKLGSLDLKYTSEIIFEAIFEASVPDFRKLESALLSLFSKSIIDSDLINFENFTSRKKIQNGLMKNFNQSISISQKSFIQKFKRYYQITPNEYMKLKKINQSIKLIQNNKSMTLTEIALESGFYDQSHFIRNFKKYCGYSPKKHLEYSRR